MADWNHSFDYFAFTPEEKEQLTDRLRQAAEQVLQQLQLQYCSSYH